MTPEQIAETIALLREIRNEQRAGFIRLELAIKALSPTQPNMSHTPPADDSSSELTNLERRILEFLTERPGCSPPVIRAAAMVQARHLHKTLNSLVERGYLTEKREGREGRARAFYPVPGRSLDFTDVEDIQGKRECRNCGEMEYLVKPDEIGYQPNRRLCRPCAQEVISEPTGGREWARQKRAEIESRRVQVERGATKSHDAGELAAELGVELPESEGA